MTTAAAGARDLGARGSRSPVAGPDPAGAPAPAAAALLAAVPQWWEDRARQAGLDGLWTDVTRAVLAPVPDGLDGVVADTRVTGATTSEALGAAYVAGLSQDVRARHGRHYTPPALAGHLWQMTRRALRYKPTASQLPGLLRDPACGAGALLLPAVREHVVATVRTDPGLALARLPNLVDAVDQDPAAVWLTSVVLAAEVLPLVAALPAARRRPLPALARCGDGLADHPERARAVVMNPPYGRVRLSEADRARWSHVLYGHANLYGLFMGAALDGLDDDGVIAALVPTSFTAGLYFSRLRETLGRQAPLREAAFVTSRDGVFEDVLQETCLATFTRRKAQKTTVVALDTVVQDVARVKSPRGALPWVLPRRADDAPAAAAAATLPMRLADVGYGCSTGPLVWNRRSTDLGPRAGKGRVRVVWAADLDGGILHRDRARDGLRFLRVRDGDERYIVSSGPAVLVQRTTAPEQARRLVAALLTAEDVESWGGRVVVENHVNVLRPTVEEPLLSLQTLLRVLTSEPVDRVIRSISGSVAVSAYELESIPLPDADTLRAWDQLDGDQLDAAVAAAYRLGAAG